MAEEMTMNREEELSVEEAFARIQALIKNMEREDATLEQSFADYEEGMRLVRLCTSRIDSVEQRVQQMNADGTLSSFEPEQQ